MEQGHKGHCHHHHWKTICHWFLLAVRRSQQWQRYVMAQMGRLSLIVACGRAMFHEAINNELGCGNGRVPGFAVLHSLYHKREWHRIERWLRILSLVYSDHCTICGCGSCWGDRRCRSIGLVVAGVLNIVFVVIVTVAVVVGFRPKKQLHKQAAQADSMTGHEPTNDLC